MNITKEIRGMADPEVAQHKLTQLCSLLAVLRTSAFVLEATEETQLNLLWLAHDLSLEATRHLSSLTSAM